MKYTKKILMISMAAIMGIVMIAPSVSALAPSVDDESSFLDLGVARAYSDDNRFIITSWSTEAQIPTDGSAGAFGFGIVSDGNLEAVLVATSHAGVLDSEAQSDANDAILHTHYVALVDSEDDGSGICESLEIRDITWEEPAGSVQIRDDNKVSIKYTSFEFDGTDSLTGEDISFSTNGNVDNIVSFTIDPIIGEDGHIDAVCINPVDSVDPKKLKVN